MKFTELAKLLDQTYTDEYHIDRDRALRNFGSKHIIDLVEMVNSGHTLEKLVQKARIGGESYFAKRIHEGMNRATN